MTELRTVDNMKLTRDERDEHFFKKGYSYAVLHLRFGLKEEKLKGLEKLLLKHLDFLEGGGR